MRACRTGRKPGEGLKRARWNVEVCRAGTFTERRTVRANEAKSFRARKDGNVLELTWNRLVGSVR